MAKFTQVVSKPKTAEEREAKKAAMKKAMEGYKNPFASTNPFKDEEDLIFEDLVEVSWTHEKWGSGKYLALSFVGKEPTMSLSAFLKEIEGYETFEIKDTDKAKTFKNVGGFAEWLRGQSWNENLVDDIYTYFADTTRNNKAKVKLTKYYIPLGSSRKACTLTNLV